MIQNIHQLLEQAIALAEQELLSFQEEKGVKDHKSAVASSLFRQIIELSIGVKVSAENGLRTPTEIIYRGFLENYLALKYILIDPSTSIERASAYKIGYHIQQIESAKEMIALEATIQIDRADIEKVIEFHTNIINKPEFSLVLNEFNNLKRTYYPKWYSLFSGPKTLKELAEALEGSGNLLYSIYGALSTSAHSYTAIRALSSSVLLPIQSSFDPSNDTYNLNVIASFLTSSINRFTVNLYPDYGEKIIPFLKDYKEFKERLSED